MELKTENKKAKNIILGIISCIVIAMLVWGIIAVSSKKDSEESGRESIKTTGQTKASKEDLTLNTGNIGEGETSPSEEKTEDGETDTTKEEADTDITSGEGESSTAQTVNQGTTAAESAPNPSVTSKPENPPLEQSTTPPETPVQPATTPHVETIDEKVNRIVSAMTLEEKVYQMIIVAPESLTGQGRVTQAGQTTRDCINKYPVGGIIYFGTNIVNESQITEMLSNTQKYSLERTGLKIFTCIDEEGGRVARIGNNTAFPVKTFSDMAYIKGEAEAYNVGDTIGGYLSRYGFNVDFAPCADVITNPENKVIGTRSFGTEPGVVSSMSLSVAKGLKSHGILAAYKHFPGHGATMGDTHEGFAYTDKTLEELMKSELVPFKSAADNGIDMVMAAHISVPKVIGDNTPSSLSYRMITGVLREQLGYKGLVVTDALNMGAIANNYTSEAAAVMAVKAGNDLLLMPKDFKAAAGAIINEVRNGNISEERIDESVRKIVRAKLYL